MRSWVSFLSRASRGTGERKREGEEKGTSVKRVQSSGLREAV